GGGSILHFDGDRARAGPASAGAVPGPAAYGRGGPPTVTDANLVLGRLDPSRFPAVFGPEGVSPLDPAASRAALSALAERMGLASPEAAAEGFLAVAVEQTAQAVRRISTERGFDPRDHALVAFGGAAGQVACDVAEALGIDEVLCPGRGSVLSAWGMGQARPAILRQAGLEAPLDPAGLAAADGLARRLSREALDGLIAQGVTGGQVEVRLGLRYDGADAVLAATPGQETQVRAAFETAHRRLFGFVEAGRPILIARVEAEAVEATPPRPPAPSQPPLREPTRTSGVMQMTRRGSVHDATVLEAASLSGIEGPALILRDDTQLAVLPGWRAQADDDGLVRLLRTAGSPRREVRLDRPDPVTLELFNRRFMGVAEAMGAALERTAHSVNIKERLDFSCALFDADGGLVANAPHMP
ncbi:MAG: hydantoinase/oxoprolinase family protein, partial [Phenylobacterium sp.]